MKAHKYTWKRDYHDARDHYVETSPHFKLTKAALPSSVDLRKWCSPVEDQGQLGSCTGNALVAAMEFIENKDGLFEQAGKFVDLSRLFVYYNERVIEGTVTQDAGAMISDGIKSLVSSGICTEATWPYNIAKFAVRPSAKAIAEAKTRKITHYARVSRDNGIIGVKTALASNYPVVFGFTVYESFESDAVAQTGILPMPAPGEQILGGHAVLAVGYNDATQRIIVRNSWGSGWGQAGYFTMPYAYAASRTLANDFWTITGK